MNNNKIMNDLNKLIQNKQLKININGRVCHHRIVILYALTELFNLNNYIEIGVHNGSSMSYVIQSPKNKFCLGIDPFEDLKTNDKNMVHYQKNDKITLERSVKNIEKNNIHKSDIQLLKKLSKDVTDKDIQSTFDLLFIDGDHTRTAVKDDYNKFIEYVKPGGFIVLDDLHQEGPKLVFNDIIKNDKRVELIGIYNKTEGIFKKL